MQLINITDILLGRNRLLLCISVSHIYLFVLYTSCISSPLLTKLLLSCFEVGGINSLPLSALPPKRKRKKNLIFLCLFPHWYLFKSRSLGWEDPLEKEMATHSSILVWKTLWMEEPGGLQSMVLQRVGHDLTTNAHTLYSV